MRLRFVCRDTDYLKALISRISDDFRGLYFEIGSELRPDIANRIMLVTDHRPEEMEPEVLAFSRAIVFIESSYVSDVKFGHIYKFENSSRNMSRLAERYCLWTGDEHPVQSCGEVLAVVGSGSPDHSVEFAGRLARELIYLRNAKPVMIQLGCVNDFGDANETDYSSFARMMYYIEAGRNFDAEAFCFRDNYGVGYIRLPLGRNPLAGLDKAVLYELFERLLGKAFDTAVVCIGTELTDRNIAIAAESSHIFCLEQRGYERMIAEIFRDREDRIRIDESKGRDAGSIDIDGIILALYAGATEGAVSDEEI